MLALQLYLRSRWCGVRLACIRRRAGCGPAALAAWLFVLLAGNASWAVEPSAEERGALERIALGKARGELVESAYAQKLGDSLTVGDWAARDMGRDRALRLWLRRTPAYGAAHAYSDGSCDVAVRLEPAELAHKLEELASGPAAPGAGAALSVDFAGATRDWGNLWAQGTAWRVEVKLGQRPEGWEEITDEGMDMAQHAAEADARQALLDAIGGLSVTRARRLSTFLESGAEVREAVASALQQSAIVETSFSPEQAAVAQARIGLLDLIRTLTEVYERSYHGDLFHANDFRGMGLLATVTEVSAAGLAVPPMAATSRPRYRGGDLEVPPWAAARMTATGRYEPVEDDKLSVAEQAERARLAGVKELRQGVQALIIKRGMTTSAFFGEHAELQGDLDAFLSTARAAESPSTQPGGVVAVPVELPLRRLWWIIRYGLHPDELEFSEESTSQPAGRDMP